MTDAYVAGKPVEVDSSWLRRLEDRVRSAERVCSLVGITGTDRKTDRGKALTQAWMEWVHVYGGQSVKVTDDEVARLAAVRDDKVAETIARLDRDYPEITVLVAGSQEITGPLIQPSVQRDPSKAETTGAEQ